MAAVGKRITFKGIVRNKSRTQDNGAHSYLMDLVLILQVHRTGGAKFLARLAPPPLLKIDTLLRINHIL